MTEIKTLSCFWCDELENNEGGYDENGNWYCENCWDEYQEQEY